MDEMGFNDKLDRLLPGDDATLAEWIAFAREAFAEAPFVTSHLEDLAERDGRRYRVGFSTKDFFLYLDAYKFGMEHDRAKWEFWEEAG